MNKLSIVALSLNILGSIYSGSSYAQGCTTHSNDPLQLHFSAPAGLIVNVGNEDENHISFQVKGSDNNTWYAYPAGTTVENGHLLGGHSTCPGINGFYQIDIKAELNNKTIDTYMSVVETAEKCVFRATNNTYPGSDAHIYRIHFETKNPNVPEKVLIRNVDICGQMNHRLSIKLENVVNGFLLPMAFSTRSINDDVDSDPAVVYVPITA